jgi:hypothetical protein
MNPICTHENANRVLEDHVINHDKYVTYTEFKRLFQLQNTFP